MSRPIIAIACALLVCSGASCLLPFEDRCDGVVCGDGQICLDLEDGPTCVCDYYHEEVDGKCEPVEEEEVDAGPVDAG